MDQKTLTIPQTLREAVQYDYEDEELLAELQEFGAILDDDGDCRYRGWTVLPDFEYTLTESFLSNEEMFLADYDTLQGDLFILLVAEVIESGL